MEYRSLAKAGVKVTSVSLGSWLPYGGAAEEDTDKARVRWAEQSGSKQGRV